MADTTADEVAAVLAGVTRPNGKSYRPTGNQERWLPVVGWEDLYEVSDLGRVRSQDRWTEHRNRWGLTQRFCRGRILRMHKGKYGHHRVTFCRGGEQATVNVHTLVLEAFIGLRPPGMEACHGTPEGTVLRSDDGGLCDALVNLRWGTHVENMADRDRHGTTANGERSGNSKLTSAQRLIVAAASVRPGTSDIRELAERFGVHRQTVVRIREASRDGT